ncbi:hypothetical protein [Gluconacetobacter entanii]|uniref:hypothetical protein n=1 Tax=Gluconacetobacter entanii TaxID=108528 RepID=UPI0011B66EEE|nr:hypothetical protein [Gluconacetobacter entanii]MCE2577685.1 hypothetical protein [Komagataeibacter sp. FNDCR1]
MPAGQMDVGARKITGLRNQLYLPKDFKSIIVAFRHDNIRRVLDGMKERLVLYFHASIFFRILLNDEGIVVNGNAGFIPDIDAPASFFIHALHGCRVPEWNVFAI